MNDVIIHVEKLAKSYFRDPFQNKREISKDILRKILNLKRRSKLTSSEFWAVQEVSFTLKKGECLGIVGTNGSGKSTTLKMLAGIIKANRGKVYINGSSQALINLGAGFRKELSGRQNIVEAATLSGIAQSEIETFTQSIIEFSELGEFIDFPVQTYSSGMYARLGFSVAVNLKPDLLLVDEILAVGDHRFQNKCKIHMQKLIKSGTSVVLVSHSNAQISQLCDKVLWLNKGVVQKFGETKDVLPEYIDFNENNFSDKKKVSTDMFGSLYPNLNKIKNLEIKINKESTKFQHISPHTTLEISFSFTATKLIDPLNITISFYREDGLLVNAFNSLEQNQGLTVNPGEKISGKLYIKENSFSRGEYYIVLPIHEGVSYLYRDIVGRINVKSRSSLHNGVMDMKFDYQVESTKQ